MLDNFTTSDIWNKSLYYRYSLDRILKINNLYFVRYDDVYRCQHFFNFDINSKTLDLLDCFICYNQTLRFSYIDQPLYEQILNWTTKHNYKVNVIDVWDAPKLKLEANQLTEHLLHGCGSQIAKNYKRYQKTKDNYHFKDSLTTDVYDLWKDVMVIDDASWKKRTCSDMKSLDREDLQYIFFLIENKKDAFLNIIYDNNDIPLAYSLFFKNNISKEWYAVKWGASDDGRSNYTGFDCLFNHLEKLEQLDEIVYLDFWGRRSETYDQLKNTDIKRYHVEISKGSELDDNKIR